MPDKFNVIIVYGTNKQLQVEESETIGQVKLGAMKLFGIDTSEAGKFVLKAKVEGKEEALNEAQTVAYYKVHPEQKITLASGNQYG